MATRATIELNRHDYVSLLQRIKFFQKIIHEISERKPLNKLLDEIIISSKKLLDSEAASLLLYNREDKKLYFHIMSGGSASLLKSKTINLGEGIAGWTAERKESLIINDCYNDPRFNKHFDSTTGFHTNNMICVPMLAKGELIGVIQAVNKKNKESFTKEDAELFEALAGQCAIVIENARLIDVEIKAEQTKLEMETAAKIQKRFLPDKLPDVKTVEMSIKLMPAKEIGGDYFNVIKIDDDTTLFFIGDVSGKSIPAALIVSTLYSFLQFFFIISREKFDSINMVQSFNRFLIGSTNPDKFATAWFGIFNSASKTLVSINAGHNPPYLLKHGESSLIKLSKGGLMLGSMDLPYSLETYNLETNDIIFFYTDGITEAMNLKEEEFGETRFEKIILTNKNLQPEKLSNLIFDEIKKYRGNAEQSDDITLGIIKIKTD